LYRTAISEHNLFKHFANARSVGDICRESQSRDRSLKFQCRRRRCLNRIVVISFEVALQHQRSNRLTQYVRLLSRGDAQPLADSRACTDHDHNFAEPVPFRRHALQLCLFKQPIFDIEGLLLRQRNVFVDASAPRITSTAQL